ncbi:MAG: hypothetical protein LC737_05340, partial [Chloroflexi bacterium]|nr:hypothetical protein [Chloroflexota bacterium]
MQSKKFLMALLLVTALAVVLGACSPSGTTVPAGNTPSSGAVQQPTSAGGQQPEAVKASNPPTSPEQVDSIKLEGKNIEVTYWHNRPQKDQDLLQTMLDEFSKSNPYGIKA